MIPKRKIYVETLSRWSSNDVVPHTSLSNRRCCEDSRRKSKTGASRRKKNKQKNARLIKKK